MAQGSAFGKFCRYFLEILNVNGLAVDNSSSIMRISIHERLSPNSALRTGRIGRRDAIDSIFD